MSNYAPSVSAGIELMGGSIDFNTGIGCTAPVGCSWDLNTFTGESQDGPEPVDENQLGGGHLNFTSNAASNVTWTLSVPAHAIQTETSEIVSFAAPGATQYPAEVNRAAHTNDTTTTAVITSYAPVQAGDLFAVMACTLAASGTITVSDPTNGTYNTSDAAITLNGIRCATFWKGNMSGSTVTITATFGTASSFTDIMMKEFANATTLDQHNLVAVTAGALGVLTGTATGTTTAANEIVFAGWACNSSCDLNVHTLTAGVNTSPWTINTFDGLGSAVGYLALSSTQTVTAVGWDNGGVNTLDVSGVMTFK
jgi:hypothetical protein